MSCSGHSVDTIPGGPVEIAILDVTSLLRIIISNQPFDLETPRDQS